MQDLRTRGLIRTERRWLWVHDAARLRRLTQFDRLYL